MQSPYLFELLLIDALLPGHLILDPLDVEPAQFPPWQCGEEGAVHVLGRTGLRTRQLWGTHKERGEGLGYVHVDDGMLWVMEMLRHDTLLVMEPGFVSTYPAAGAACTRACACVRT